MAVPSFVNAGTTTNAAGVTSRTPALPGSIVTGNLLFAFVTVFSSGKTIAVTAGWTIGDSDNTNSSAAWAWRVAAASNTAPTFSWTGSANAAAQTFQYTGTSGSPIGAFNKATAASSTAVSLSGITTTANNSNVFLLIQTSGSQTIADPWGFISGGTFASANGSHYTGGGQVYASGSVCQSLSNAPISSANWNAWFIEFLGSGSTANEPKAKATQVVVEVLRSVSSIGAAEKNNSFIIGETYRG